MSDIILRVVLWVLGFCLAQGSRFMPSLRSQITKTLVFELSAGRNVARHWAFDGPNRRVSSYAGHVADPECAVHFDTSIQALRALVSTRTVDRVVTGIHNGTAHLQGSAFVLLWFYGLTRKFAPLGRPDGPRYRLPGAYLTHDPAASGSETIIVEPAVVRLDPAWTDAWRARSTLLQVRAATDEPALEP